MRKQRAQRREVCDYCGIGLNGIRTVCFAASSKQSMADEHSIVGHDHRYLAE